MRPIAPFSVQAVCCAGCGCVFEQLEDRLLLSDVSGYTGFWTFDEPVGHIAFDYSENYFDALAMGGTPTEGAVGGALGFDNLDDYVNLDVNNLIDELATQTQGSISVWFKINSLPTGGAVHSLFYYGDGGGMVAGIQTPHFGAGELLEADDYAAAPALADVTVAPIVLDTIGVNVSASLTGAALEAIGLGGTTQLRLRFTVETDADDAADREYIYAGNADDDTLRPKLIVHVAIIGDVTGDGYVDDDDLSVLLTNWHVGNLWATGDFTGDGYADDDDLSVLLTNWHEGVPPVAMPADGETVAVTQASVSAVPLVPQAQTFDDSPAPAEYRAAAAAPVPFGLLNSAGIRASRAETDPVDLLQIARPRAANIARRLASSRLESSGLADSLTLLSVPLE